MKILAIESSSMTASAAILNDNLVVAEYTLNHRKTHSQTLLPMIDEICRTSETDINTVDYIAVSAGPGSFTGLRIGSSTGKGIGLALDKQVVSVPTLEALAYNMAGTDSIVCPIMDARRGNVYTGIYEFTYDETQEAPMNAVIHTLQEQCLISMEELLAQLNKRGSKVVFVGDAVAMYRECLSQELQVPYILAPAGAITPRAASVAIVGYQYAKAGKAANAREHAPDYLRATQAERERKS